MGITTRQADFEHTTGIRTQEIYAASRLLAEITGNGVQPNKAIVGKNAFAHEAGIHQHGVLNNPLTYEIITPESIGLTSNRIVLGKHSGRFADRKSTRLNSSHEAISYSVFDLKKNTLQSMTKLYIPTT